VTKEEMAYVVNKYDLDTEVDDTNQVVIYTGVYWNDKTRKYQDEPPEEN